MSKLIGKVRILNGKVQLIRMNEGQKKLGMGCAYKMYAALRKTQGS